MFNVYIIYMNKIKSTFTIRDLENLTGIKAHTIRIWEKRYNVLQPVRTETNVRLYDTHSLQKLLNINTLNTFGYKISNIAKMPEDKLPAMVKEILSGKTENNHVISNFKLAMVNFDQHLFTDTYNSLLKSKTFSDIFYDCFLPLLREIGELWQTETITPAHEHFISCLIKQKIAVNTEVALAKKAEYSGRVYVLYLPEGEVHEIGLLFINYELLARGYQTIYLGESIPVQSLNDLNAHFDSITFITYFTVEPSSGEAVGRYMDTIKETLLNQDATELMLFGRNAHNATKSGETQIKTFINIKDFTNTL